MSRLKKGGVAVAAALDSSPESSRRASPRTPASIQEEQKVLAELGIAESRTDAFYQAQQIPILPNIKEKEVEDEAEPTLGDVMKQLKNLATNVVAIKTVQATESGRMEKLIEQEVGKVKQSVQIVDSKVSDVSDRVKVLEEKDDKVSDEVQQMQKRLAKLEFAATKSSLTISGFSSSTSHEDRIKVINKKIKDICGSIAGFIAPNHFNTFTKDKANTSCTLIEFPNSKSRNIVLTAFKDVKWSNGSAQLKVNHAKTPEQLRKHYLMTQAELKAKAAYPDHKVEVVWMQWPRLVTVTAKGEENPKTVFEQSKGDDGKWLDGDVVMGDK